MSSMLASSRPKRRMYVVQFTKASERNYEIMNEVVNEELETLSVHI